MAIILDGTAGEQLSGNLTFTGTGQRIIGDFSNGTLSNRTMFQTSSSNTSTIVTAIPSGTGVIAQFQANSSSDPNNSSVLGLVAYAGNYVSLTSNGIGTGTILPMKFYMGATEAMSIATDGTITSNLGGIQVRSGTAVSASGTSVDFTSIPSWVKRITIMFNGVSTSGTSNLLVQLGDSGGVENTGYVGAGSVISSAVTTSSYTTGFGIRSHDQSTFVTSGAFVITNVSGNIWIASGTFANPTTALVTGTTGGTKTLSDVLDRIRITTVNGTDTFDAGSINILYE